MESGACHGGRCVGLFGYQFSGSVPWPSRYSSRLFNDNIIVPCFLLVTSADVNNNIVLKHTCVHRELSVVYP